MVFELTDGLAACPAERWNTLSICISNLLVGYYEGNLAIVASGALCNWMLNRHLADGPRESVALNHLLNNNAYRPNVLWNIRVVLENPDFNNHELGIDFFNTTESALPSSMLCENLDDIRFYMKQARHYYPDSPMAVTRWHGGGGTTVDVFRTLKSRNLFCLVILDSDIKYPGCPLGDTASRCVTSYRVHVPNMEVKVLPVHEAENLVPLSFMMRNTRADGVRFLKRLQKRNMVDKLVFYDIKDGITKEKTEEFPDYKVFASELFEGLNPRNRNGFDAYYCLKTNLTDYVYPQINPNMLSLFIGDGSRSYEVDVMELYRREIADLVYTFVCCRGNYPIN